MSFCPNTKYIDIRGSLHVTAMLQSFVTPIFKLAMLKQILYLEATVEVHSSDVLMFKKMHTKLDKNIKSNEDCYIDENAMIYMSIYL